MDKVLIVDDEKNILRGFNRLLHGISTVDTASNASIALKKVAENGPYSVILTDMMMPGMNGVELLKTLEIVAPNSIKVMLTGNTSQKIAMDAINLGKVYKFLMKPIDGDELKQVIASAIELYNDKLIEASESSYRELEINTLTSKLRFHYNFDSLTGLLNRTTFIQNIAQIINNNKSVMYTLCYLDIDHFLVVNESVGATGGDEFLKQISNILINITPTETVLARLGGNGFGLLLNIGSQDIKPLMENIRFAINSHVFKWQNSSLNVSASFGLISVEDNIKDTNTLLHLAENACCLAKENGRNRIHYATLNDDLLSKKMRDINWVNRLSGDEGLNQLVLYQQEITPISSSHQNKRHYEILLRFKEENGDIILPSEFLPAAEHYQISQKIDRWVIMNCAQMLSKSSNNNDNLSLCSINLSGHSINDPEMETFITQTFSQFNIPKEKICFEITETAAIGYFAGAVEFITKLKEQGFLFSLDDFGTGLSSYEYLKSLPVDMLKIDGSFVQKMDNNKVDFALTKSICEVGKAMGLKIVAECVENESVFKLLREIGVDYAQGFYLNRPSVFIP
jgi:diguanylate cyclase (GGDEF)-like protein